MFGDQCALATKREGKFHLLMKRPKHSKGDKQVREPEAVRQHCSMPFSDVLQTLHVLIMSCLYYSGAVLHMIWIATDVESSCLLYTDSSATTDEVEECNSTNELLTG